MTYSTDFRQLALQKIEQGLSVRQAAQEMGIVRATLRGWIKNPIPKGYPSRESAERSAEKPYFKMWPSIPMPTMTNGHSASAVLPPLLEKL